LFTIKSATTTRRMRIRRRMKNAQPHPVTLVDVEACGCRSTGLDLEGP
jgi:hypothetical protein